MMKNVQGDLSDQGNHHMEDQEVSDGGGVCEKLYKGGIFPYFQCFGGNLVKCI